MNIKDIKKIGVKNMVLLLIAGLLLLICAAPGVFREENKDGSSTLNQQEAVVTAVSTPTLFPSVEERLKAILSTIDGVGKTEVMICYSSSEEQVPLVNEKGNLVQTIRGEETYIKKINAPEIEGIMIVAEGAKKSEVMQYISDAAEALFGIPKHKIIVLPMSKESGRN